MSGPDCGGGRPMGRCGGKGPAKKNKKTHTYNLLSRPHDRQCQSCQLRRGRTPHRSAGAPAGSRQQDRAALLQPPPSRQPACKKSTALASLSIRTAESLMSHLQYPSKAEDSDRRPAGPFFWLSSHGGPGQSTVWKSTTSAACQPRDQLHALPSLASPNPSCTVVCWV